MATLGKKRLNRKRKPNANLASRNTTQTGLDVRRISPADFEKVRHEIIHLVCSRAVETVDQMMEHVRAGNFQAMKYLFEMVGLFPVPAIGATTLDDSLAKQLLNYLGAEESVNNELKVHSVQENRP